MILSTTPIWHNLRALSKSVFLNLNNLKMSVLKFSEFPNQYDKILKASKNKRLVPFIISNLRNYIISSSCPEFADLAH